MRKKGILLLLILIAIFVGLSFLLTDKWLESQLEKAGSSIVGAKVEIDNLDISLLGLHARWDSLQVTDPKNTMQNMLVTGRCDFDFRLLPMLSQKLIIDEIAVTNLQSGVPRTTDGKIEKPPKKPKSDKPTFIDKTVTKLSKEMEDAPVFQMDSFTKKINVDSLIALLSIKSPQKIDSLYKQVTGQYEALQSQAKAIKPKEEIAQLQALAEKIKIDEIKDLNTLISTLQTLKTIQTRVDTLQNQIKRTNKGIQALVEESRHGKNQVESWVRSDYNQALSKAKLPEINAQNVGKLIFGKKVVYQVNRVLGITRQVRYYAAKFKSDKPKKEKPPRLKGQNIHFSLHNALPKFWIQEVILSGRMKGLDLKGEATHFASNQKLTGHPAQISLNGQNDKKTAVGLNAEFDYRTGSKESYSANLSRWSLEGLQLSESPLLPYTINKGLADIESNLVLTGDTLKGTIDFTARQLAFNLNKKPSNRAEELIQNVVKKANTVRFTSRISAVGDEMSFTVQSNLDDLIVKEIKSLASKEVAAAKQRLRQEIENRTAGPKKEFNQFVTEKQKALQDTWTEYQKTIDAEKQKLEQKKKDLEKRIEDEKKKQENKLQDEVKNKLNDLLKSN